MCRSAAHTAINQSAIFDCSPSTSSSTHETYHHYYYWQRLLSSLSRMRDTRNECNRSFKRRLDVNDTAQTVHSRPKRLSSAEIRSSKSQCCNSYILICATHIDNPNRKLVQLFVITYRPLQIKLRSDFSFSTLTIFCIQNCRTTQKIIMELVRSHRAPYTVFCEVVVTNGLLARTCQQ